MNRFVTVVFAVIMLSVAASAQPITLRTVCDVPAILEETSGLEITEGLTFWSFNDSGGEPELYMFDSTGTLYRTLRIENASNVDWEEVAQDDSGNFYIGDFGNNANSRNDLRIYKIPNPLPMSSDRTMAEIISFSYAEQTAFPPPEPERNFDMEAMLWHAGALYLFSKNRSNPYSGMVYMYTIPDTPGTYSIARIDSFDTGESQMLTSWVTAADISPDGSRVLLLSQSKAWLFTDFTGDAFFGGTVRQLDFTSLSQTEALCFATNSSVYISDELVGGILGGKLYHFDLSDVVNVEALPPHEGLLLNAFPNPFSYALTISTGLEHASGSTSGSISLYNTTGRRVYYTSTYGTPLRLSPPYAAVPPGVYVAVVQSMDEILTKTVIRR